MAMSARDGGGEDVVSEINVTPLVDVMLVLLVVFIVTAPLLSNAVTVNLPKTAINSPPQQKKALSVSIDKDGKIFLDRTPVELPALEGELRKLNAGSEELSVQLNADEGVDYGVVAKAISSIDRGGVKRLSVMTAGE
jgi:biopolymer transport protein ExbD